ncbi:MAG: RNA polymerase sigma factor [Planctomycetota bacterium]
MDLDRLIDRYRGPLTGLLAAWGNDRQRAIDLAQDTFAEAYLGRDQFRGGWSDDGAVGAWLRGIAHNLHHGLRRRDRGPRALRRLDSLDELPAAAVATGAGDDGGHPLVPPMQRALESLRGPWRTVLTMRYLEGSGLAEIAALLGLSPRAVEGRLRRARAELKAALERMGHAPAATSADLDTEEQPR